MTGSIARLTRYRENGVPGETLTEVRLLRGVGMEGNLHHGGERQLCLLTAEARRWMDAQTEKGLCFHRFKENLLFEDVPLEELSDGDLLAISDACLRISGRKHCFDECPRVSGGLECRLSRCSAFAVVQEGGTVRVGDRVVCKRGSLRDK